jgi:TIR domain
VQDLRNLLAQKMGRNEAFSIWWDEIDLRGNHNVTSELRTILQQSATLLIVLSPGYLASKWCMQERDLFFEVLGGNPQGRVFVVEKHVLDEDLSRPAELADIKGYYFWYRDERNQARTLSIREPEPYATAYIRLVEDLATDISRQLKVRAAVAPSPPAKPKATVFLAEVTDDLEPRREQVRRYLEQAQLQVLPTRRHLEGQAFRDALEQALGQSTLFIQLLGEYLGRRPPDIPQGYPRLQLERAQARKLPILQWHDPTLKLDQVESPEQRELLEAVSVYAEPLESFKQRIVQQALPPPPPPPVVHAATPVVFINTERRDRTLAEAIRDQVDARLMVTLPVSEGKAAEVRKELEQKLVDCDALIVVYGQTTLDWVDKQLLYCNRIAPKRERPFLTLGVYDGPPEEKPTVSTRMPGLEILMGRQGLDAQRLQAFLAPLLQRVQL